MLKAKTDTSQFTLEHFVFGWVLDFFFTTLEGLVFFLRLYNFVGDAVWRGLLKEGMEMNFWK